jgi:hypothetical protein
MSAQDNITISLIVPKSLLAQVDQLAKRDYVSRSGLIRQVVLEYVRQSGVGEVEIINKPPIKRTPPSQKTWLNQKHKKILKNCLKR